MKRYPVDIVIAFFLMLLLVAIYRSEHPLLPEPSRLQPTASAAFASPSPFPTFAIPAMYTSRPTETSTVTPTLDYAALGLPSPTPTPTLDYAALASHYLTPQPTSTRPTRTRTPPPVDPLSLVVARRLPANWTPTPPSLRKLTGAWTAEGDAQYIQAATDLMNFVQGDSQLYIQYVESWTPPDRHHVIGEEWILRDDFDNDGQPEWFLSLPYYWESQEPPCCTQYLILFEEVDGIFQPVHYDRDGAHNHFVRAILVDDLNNDGYREIVLQSVSCGTACSETLRFGTWDGRHWKNDYLQSQPPNHKQFLDVNHDGTVEVIVSYSPRYKLDSRYPYRPAIDVYGWEDGSLVIQDEIRQPTTDHYGIMRDVFSALSFGKIQQAIDLAQPILAELDQTCGRMETYIAIETMLAYGAQGDPQRMQSTLSSIMAHCDGSDNGFVKAANILWQAYQQVHDPQIACEAMRRFIVDEMDRSHQTKTPSQFFDPTVVLPGSYVNFCPLGQH